MFEGSQMSAYLKSYGVNYELIRFGSKPSQIKHLVNISDDAFINEIGTKKTALSSSQFRTNKKALCEQLDIPVLITKQGVKPQYSHEQRWNMIKNTMPQLT